jgi:4-amino-4-deoxy-L-arabinose transferase-like glycosyltransferase
MKPTRPGELKSTANVAGPPRSPLPEAAGRPGCFTGLLLPALLLAFVVIAGVHAWRAPAGSTGYQDAPDEEAHVTFVRVVASGRLPSRQAPSISATAGRPDYEWHQPPLYYALAAPLLPFGVLGLRLFSILLGAASIVTIYAAARLLLPDRPETALLAAGIAALIPGHTAIMSSVNNDSLLELCFSVTLLLLITAQTRGFTLQRSLLLGAVLGAALLTKLTAILLLPVILLALVQKWRNGAPLRDLVRASAIVAATALVISGMWFVRNGVIYHEWLPLTAFRQSFERTAKATDIVGGQSGLHVNGWVGYMGLVAQWTLQSFFAVYSTKLGSAFGMPAFLPTQLYLLAGGAAAVALGGLAMAYMRRRAEFTRIQICGLWLLAATIALVTASFALFTARYFQAQGRYFYPAMLPISVLAALGWRSAFPERYADAASVLLLATFFACCLVFLRTTY